MDNAVTDVGGSIPSWENFTVTLKDYQDRTLHCWQYKSRRS